jgi:serine/threonine protein kinase
LSEEKLNDPNAVDLMKRMLDIDPTTRITIKGVLGHPYFMGSEEAVAFICKAVDEVLKPEMSLVEE